MAVRVVKENVGSLPLAEHPCPAMERVMLDGKSNALLHLALLPFR